MGGLPAGAVEMADHGLALWEKRVDALLILLSRLDPPLVTVHELRRNIESLGAEAYDTLTYYERWMHAIAHTLVQRGVIGVDELGRKIAEVEQRAARSEP
jgi:nitrile hydratase subunit beta